MEFALGSVFKLKYVVKFQTSDDQSTVINIGTRCYVANNENVISLVTLNGELQCIDVSDIDAAKDIFEPSDELELTSLLCDWDIKYLDLDGFSTCDAPIDIYSNDKLIASVVVPKRIPDSVYFRFSCAESRMRFDNLIDETAAYLYEMVTGADSKAFTPSYELKRLLNISVVQYLAARMNKGAIKFIDYLADLEEIYPAILEATITPQSYYAS